MLERVGLMPKSGIEMKIVGLKLEEWDCVQRVGYDTNSGIGVGVQWVRTVRNTGMAVINTVQTGKNQTETGRSFFLGNSKRVGSKTGTNARRRPFSCFSAFMDYITILFIKQNIQHAC